jgi:hypothetical protein
MFYRGDHVENNETYIFGKTTVRVVAPENMSPEERQRRINQMNKAFRSAWQSLPIEKQVQINKKCKTENT